MNHRSFLFNFFGEKKRKKDKHEGIRFKGIVTTSKYILFKNNNFGKLTNQKFKILALGLYFNKCSSGT